MSEMNHSINRVGEFPRWLHELLLSIYCSFLFAWTMESLSPPVPTRYLYFWHPHAVSLGRVDFLLFYFELFLILAGAIFFCLKLIRRFSFTRFLLRIIAGAIALAGFPLVCVYRQGRQGLPSLFLDVEFALAAVCFLLWAYRRWPLSAALSVVLLILHYTLWSLFGRAPDVTQLGSWNVWDHAWLVFPALGLAYTLVWAGYFRHSGPTEQLSSSAAPG